MCEEHWVKSWCGKRVYIVFYRNNYGLEFLFQMNGKMFVAIR